MQRSSLKNHVVAAVLLLGSLASAACGTDSTSPALGVTPVSIVAPSSFIAAPVYVSVHPALRGTPLANDVVVSAVIGRKGGKIRVRQTGLVLTVPRGAVSAPTTFQVTALAGSIVAYEFEPHGTTFAAPLTFSQDFKDLDLKSRLGLSPRSGPQVSYFQSSAQLQQDAGTALVTEQLPAVVVTDVHGRHVEGNIYHFSGYLVSSARQ